MVQLYLTILRKTKYVAVRALVSLEDNIQIL